MPPPIPSHIILHWNENVVLGLMPLMRSFARLFFRSDENLMKYILFKIFYASYSLTLLVSVCPT